MSVDGAAAVAGAAASALASSSVAAILTPSRGWNWGTGVRWTISVTRLGSIVVLPVPEPVPVRSPNISARRFATARMNSICKGSDGSNAIGVGGFLAPDQNGVPAAVRRSNGKLCNSCLTLLANSSSKQTRAQIMQSFMLNGRALFSICSIRFSVSRRIFCWAARPPPCGLAKSGSVRYWTVSWAAILYTSSNQSRAHCSVWSI
mmetsp:Transcript_27682/g.46475  ORF Transcript_27682/g.46475 Transcript_27682/m.46475 type:complete len:204 (-) Transcript_27682:57-668(-)